MLGRAAAPDRTDVGGVGEERVSRSYEQCTEATGERGACACRQGNSCGSTRQAEPEDAMQGCRPLTEEVYSIEKVVEKGIVLELATTSRKFPKSFRPMEALGQDLAAHVSVHRPLIVL